MPAEVFHIAEAAEEAAVGLAEGPLHVQAQLPAHIDQGEEQVPQLPPPFLRRRGLEHLFHLFLQLFHHPLHPFPVKALPGSPDLDFLAIGQGGEAWRNILQEGPSPFPCLQPVPLVQHPFLIQGLFLPKHMGVTVDKLAGDAPDDLLQGELPCILGDAGVKEDLHQQVPQLQAELRGVALVQGLQGLIALLQQVGPEGEMGLLPVPRALPAETGHDFRQGVKAPQVPLRGIPGHNGASLYQAAFLDKPEGLGYPESELRVLAFFFFALFLVALPLFFFSTAVRGVSENLPLYMWGFNRHGVARDLGITPQELEEATQGLLAYFNSPLEPVHVIVRGEELFNERERLHLRDVKQLFVLNRQVQAGALAYVLAFVAGNWLWRRTNSWASTLKALRWGSALTVLLILALGVAAVVGFDRLFLAFHLVSFSNPFWQLDPATDKLIVMMPEGFFYDLFLVTFGATALMALVVGIPSHLLLRLKFGRK